MRRVALSIAVLLVVSLLAPALLAPAAASPQPTPICHACGPVFEAGAADRGVNATVEESTVVVQIHENGTATWTIRNRLGSGADEFREDEQSLERLARWLGDRSYGVVDDSTTSLVSARMDGETAVLTYRDADPGARHAGLFVVDYLHDGGYEPWYHVNADRFTIRGPPGTVVTNDPESGRVDGRSVTWLGSTGEEVYDSPSLRGSPYVVFGPDRSLETRARTTLALAQATQDIVVRSLRTYLVYQTAVFALALAAVVGVLRSRPPGGDSAQWAGAVAVLGALGGVALAVFSDPRWVFGPVLFGGGLGLAAYFPVRKRFRTPRRQALGAGGALVATVVALMAIDALAMGFRTVHVGEILRFSALALPVAAMLPLGGALAADLDSVLPWWGLAVVAFAAVPAVTVNFADPPSGFGSGLFAVVLLGLAVVAPVVGTFVLALGRSLAVEDESTDS